jgi:hypothetical protein
MTGPQRLRRWINLVDLTTATGFVVARPGLTDSGYTRRPLRPWLRQAARRVGAPP